MWLIQLAQKNMWRNRLRTLITATAVFFAVILSVLAESLKQGIFDNLVKNIVSFYTGYIQVHQKGYWEEKTLDNSFSYPSPDFSSLVSQTFLKNVSPRIEAFALASSATLTRGCMVLGIVPAQEEKNTSLNNKNIQGEYLNDSDHAVLLSEGLAKKLSLRTGDTLYLIGQGYQGSTAAGKYRVKGILSFGSPDLNETSLFMPLSIAQDFLGAYGMTTSLVCMLNDPNQLEKVKTQLQHSLNGKYEVMTWGEMLPEIKQHIEADSGNMEYVQLILYLLVCFGIYGTLLMMMMERKYEMGMLIAIGMNKHLLAFTMLLESVFTVLAGCIAGLRASIPICWYFSEYPFRISGEAAKAYERFGFEAVFPASTNPSIFIEQGITVFVLSLLLSVYPVYKVYRTDPVLSMKR
jgi:ABC-type lipoprotein release transport system permease subunit